MTGCNSGGAGSGEEADKSEETTKEETTTTTEETTTETTPTTTAEPTPVPEPEPIPQINVGDVFSDEKAEYLLVSAEITDLVNPPDTSGWYSYYSAQDGEDYFCVIMDVTNTDTTSLSYDASFLDIDLIYDDTYEYTSEDCGFTISVVNGDFYTYGGNIPPLGTERLYYLCFLPEAASQGDGSLVATINLPTGGKCEYVIR